MDRLLILLPALVFVAVLTVAFTVYAVRCALGRPPVIAYLKSNDVFGLYTSRFAYWCAQPLERALVAGAVSPDAVTLLSLIACVGAGVAVGLGQLAAGCWLYLLGGFLDLLDGRLARALGRQSTAGALLDSVADRWAELAVYAGYAWYLRATPWLGAALGANAAAMMVSYTRARGEALGLSQRGGAMQRAERIVLVAVGTLVAALFSVDPARAGWVVPTVGGVLALCGALSARTAVGRLLDGHRALRRAEAAAVTAASAAPALAAVEQPNEPRPRAPVVA